MNTITEEMRYRQEMCEYAKKHGVTITARRYHTNRQFVYRQLKKYDGSVRSLALKSRKPHSHPNSHTEEELDLIKRMLKRNGRYGLQKYTLDALKTVTQEVMVVCVDKYVTEGTKKLKKLKRAIQDTIN